MLVLTGMKGEVTAITFSPDGKLLAAGSGFCGQELWELPSGGKWGRYAGMFFHNYRASFHPTRPLCFVVINGGLGVIRTDIEKAQWFAPADNAWLAQPTMTPEGESFVCQIHSTTDELRRYRRPGKELTLIWARPLDRPSARSSRSLSPVAIRVTPDGAAVVALSGPRTLNHREPKPVRVSVRATADGEGLRVANLPTGTTSALAVAPDSRTFVTCRKHIMSVWPTDNLKVRPREVRSDSRCHLTALAFHPSGRYLAATSNDETVKLYDTATWEVVRSFTWDIGRMRSVAFSPDGALAAVGSDRGRIVVWDVDV
jgi:WD40 repeat protein